MMDADGLVANSHHSTTATTMLTKLLTSDTMSQCKARKLVHHHFASAQAHLSKLECQRALPPNSSLIIKKNCSSFPTRQQSTIPELYATLSLSMTHGRKGNSSPILQTCNLTKLNATLRDSLQHMACKMLSTSNGSPPPNSGTFSLHMEGNCKIWREWNVSRKLPN